MTTLYGIPNCDTIKKARKWLTQHNIEFVFHDFRKEGLDENQLKSWFEAQGVDVVINKRGTTWRQLDEATKSDLDAEKAVKLALDNPAIIKRPVLIHHEKVHIGFKDADYKSIFGL